MKLVNFVIFMLMVVSCSYIEDAAVDINRESVKTQNLCFEENVTISKDSACVIVKNLYKNLDTYIYSVDSIVYPLDTLRYTRSSTIVSQPYESWLFIVDMFPNAAWSHDCKYVYVNVNTGEVSVVDEVNLPLNKEMSLVKLYGGNAQTECDLYEINNQTKTKSVGSETSRYAVIISGGTDMNDNYFYFWNDCSNIYRVLKSVYGYSDENIYVLMSDGNSSELDRNLLNGTFDSSPNDLDNDGIGDIDYSAVPSNISDVFTELSNKVGADDELFIFVSGHGSCKMINGQPNYYINLWDGNDMTASELETQLDKITPYCITNIVLNQCYSGAFVNDLRYRTNTIVSTACAQNEVSQARGDIGHFEFPYHWTAAISGKYPDNSIADADYDNDQKVSFLEAFKFSENNNFFTNSGTLNDVSYQKQTPQFAYSSYLLGYNRGMSGFLFELPELNGPDYFVYGVGNAYLLSNLSPSASVVWEYSDLLSQTNITSSTINLIKNTPVNQLEIDLFVTATVQIPSLDLSFELTKNNIVLWKGGITQTTDYIDGDIFGGEGYVALPFDLPGASGYTWYTSSGASPEYQGLYHTNFIRYARADIESEYDVWVEMYSPDGELVTIVRHYAE